MEEDCFVDLKEKIREGDLQVMLSGGIIIYSQFGSLTALRAQLQKNYGDKMIYFTISSQPLYLVHWNDLNEKKQGEMERRKVNAEVL